MSLLDTYKASVMRAEIRDDALQRQVIPILQRIIDELASARRSWFRKPRIKGLYLYGSVGVGKTYLMDLFYENIPTQQKSRFHFHHFMQYIDAELRARQGQKDPLRRIAAAFSKSTRVLCLDELLVQDVADAMILTELLHELFKHGVVLVVTANTAADDLYLNGPQRARFLPAIALLKTHCEVFFLNESIDYRLGHQPLFQAYCYPLDHAALASLTEQFKALTFPHLVREDGVLTIQQRSIAFVKCSERVVWFRFDTICNIPRSSLDYLEIAENFDTVFVSDIPLLSADDTTHAVLLIRFIDVMYDRRIRVILSAEAPAAQLYPAGSMLASFQRTLSRLEEMQSIDYLA